MEVTMVDAAGAPEGADVGTAAGTATGFATTGVLDKEAALTVEEEEAGAAAAKVATAGAVEDVAGFTTDATGAGVEGGTAGLLTLTTAESEADFAEEEIVVAAFMEVTDDAGLLDRAAEVPSARGWAGLVSEGPEAVAAGLLPATAAAWEAPACCSLLMMPPRYCSSCEVALPDAAAWRTLAS